VRRFLRWLAVLVVIALAFGVGSFSGNLVRPPLVVGQDAVTDAASSKLTPVLDTVNGARTIVAQPPSGTTLKDTLVIIYPGGLVRPQAYEWLARALAVRGYTTVIPEFSFDLAVTDTGRATALIERYAEGRRVVLAGHSLGGAMAGQYLADELKAGRQPVAGLVLMGSYPPDGADLAGSTLKAVSLRAENDHVADQSKVADGLKRLPAGSKLVQIDGAVHSFFGRYGPQSGDGVPTVDRNQAETQILAAVDAFLATL
jgi:alpha/beta superfamily hydrolase